MGVPDVPALLERGLYVFPIRAGSRRPPLRDWPNRATNDIIEARRLWTDLRIDPTNFNVGVCTRGLCVIDIDRRPSGFPDPPRTFRVRTGRREGGEHWYFRPPPRLDERIKSKALYPGEVDVKAGKGAFVVGPGSVHDGTGDTYVVIDSSPIAPLPKWIIDLLIAEGGVRPRSTEEHGFARLPDEEATEDHPILADACRAQLADLVTLPGGRNQSLFQFACRVWRDYAARLITPSTRDELLREACFAVIAADFPTEEAERCVNSAYRSVFGERP